MALTVPVKVFAGGRLVGEQAQGAGLHALINNAGIIVQGPVELTPPADLVRQFAVNVFGPAYLTRECLPLLRAGRGRVINISAPTARVPVPFLASLSASRAALEAFSDALRLELAAWRIPVVVVEPGATSTRIFAKAQAAADVAGAAASPAAVALYQPQLAAVAAAQARQRPGPADAVARVIAAAVESRSPKRRYTAGADARAAGVVSMLPAGVRERAVLQLFGLRKVPTS